MKEEKNKSSRNIYIYIYNWKNPGKRHDEIVRENDEIFKGIGELSVEGFRKKGRTNKN